MFQVTFDQKHLQAVSLFMAKKDVRYYLNGVHVVWNACCTRLEAANGPAVGIYQNGNQNQGEGAIIVPDDIVVQLCKAKAWKAGLGQITLTAESIDGEWRAQVGATVLVFKPIDGKFPEVRNVIPAECSGETAQYDPEYLLAIHKAVNILHGGKRKTYAQFTYNGKKTAVATNGTCNFMALVVPVLADTPKPEEWKFAIDPLPVGKVAEPAEPVAA